MRFQRRTKDAKIALLRGVDLFSACTKTELRRIAAAVDEVDCAEGKVLTREGDTGWECFVIAEGRAKASARGRRVATLEQGSFFGEMSLLDGRDTVRDRHRRDGHAPACDERPSVLRGGGGHPTGCPQGAEDARPAPAKR